MEAPELLTALGKIGGRMQELHDGEGFTGVRLTIEYWSHNQTFYGIVMGSDPDASGDEEEILLVEVVGSTIADVIEALHTQEWE